MCDPLLLTIDPMDGRVRFIYKKVNLQKGYIKNINILTEMNKKITP